MEKNPEAIKIISIRANGTRRVQTLIPGETRTQQQFQDQCDINKIMDQYTKTGTITHIRNVADGVYADMSKLPSYQEALQTVINAELAFNEVPAAIRNRFANDPQQFIDFLSDSNNDQEAVKLGLKVPQAKPPPNPILEELQALNKNLKPKPAKETLES